MDFQKKIVIFDIDGTLANGEHRVHHVRGPGKKNWPAYNDGMANDKVHEHTRTMFHCLFDCDYELYVVSGREDQFREVTEQWLSDNDLATYNALYMRKTGDYRSDDIVKREILLTKFLTKFKKDDIVCVFDDRPRVIRMWRSEGIPVFNCGDGTEF